VFLNLFAGWLPGTRYSVHSSSEAQSCHQSLLDIQNFC